jgi:hypothetical protein
MHSIELIFERELASTIHLEVEVNLRPTDSLGVRHPSGTPRPIFLSP